MKNLHQLTIITMILSGIGLSQTSMAALMSGGPAEGWTQTEIALETSSVSTTMNTFGSSLLTSLQKNFANLMDAISVATKQSAINGSNESDNIRRTGNILVSAIKSQRMTAQIAQAYVDYGLATGQGYDPCGTLLKNKTMDRGFSDVKEGVNKTISSFAAINGNMVTSVGDWEQAQVQLHRDKFCSQSEADAGLCTVSKVPSGDTNGALFFQAADKGSLVDQAREAYINNLLGAPNSAIDRTQGKTAAAQDFLFEQNHQSALLSIPAYSLAMIDGNNTRIPTSGNKSPNEMLLNRVNQYFGGGEAKDWMGSLARQTPRGLIVETAKVEGLQAWIKSKQIQQNDRIIANLAALVISAGDIQSKNGSSINGDAQRKAKEAAALARQNNINSGIK